MTTDELLLEALQNAPDGFNDLQMASYLNAKGCFLKEAYDWYQKWKANQEAQGDIEPEYYMGHRLEEPMDKIQRLGQEMDAINPSHYQQGDIEAIDAIRSALGDEQFKGYLKGNLMKYVWRSEHKGCPVENIEKAEWYLKRLLSELRLERECE
jgi:hypothetical protein